MKRYHKHEMNKYQLLYTAYDAVTNDLVTYCQPKFNYLLCYYIVVIILVLVDVVHGAATYGCVSIA